MSKLIYHLNIELNLIFIILNFNTKQIYSAYMADIKQIVLILSCYQVGLESLRSPGELDSA